MEVVKDVGSRPLYRTPCFNVPQQRDFLLPGPTISLTVRTAVQYSVRHAYSVVSAQFSHDDSTLHAVCPSSLHATLRSELPAIRRLSNNNILILIIIIIFDDDKQRPSGPMGSKRE